MEYFANYNALKGKLDELLAKKQMVCQFDTRQYPIKLSVRMNVSPEAQIALFETGDDKVSSRDAALQMSFGMDRIESIFVNRLVIDNETLNKIQSIAKKMHHEFLHGFYAEHTASNVLHFPEPDNADDESDNADCDSDNADDQDENTTEAVAQAPTDNDFAAFFDDEDDSQE